MTLQWRTRTVELTSEHTWLHNASWNIQATWFVVWGFLHSRYWIVNASEYNESTNATGVTFHKLVSNTGTYVGVIEIGIGYV